MAKTSVINTVQIILQLAAEMCHDHQPQLLSTLVAHSGVQSGVPLGEYFTRSVLEANGFAVYIDDNKSLIFKRAQ
jgi:hypothetical protein